MKLTPRLTKWVTIQVILFSITYLAAEEIPLWSGIAPGEKVAEAHQIKKTKDGITRLSKVTAPTLQVFHAVKTKRTGAVVLVCPGGGYNILAIEHEGTEVCKWLSENGITAVLLRYRVPRRQGLEKHHAPLQDAQRAMTLIRAHAEEWGVNPKKVGVLGFSAGGHLAATLVSAKKRNYPEDKPKDQSIDISPNFVILVYPAYIRKEKSSQKLSAELSFTKDSPPVFLVVAKNDHRYYPDSVLLISQFKKIGVSIQSHIFETGGHGFGMGTVRGGKEVKSWPELCLRWLTDMKIHSE